MSYLSWNCRGLGNLRLVQALQRLISSKDPTIVFVCDTRSNVAQIEKLRKKLNFDRSFTMASRGRSGGLCVLWKDDIDLNLQSYSQNHIDLDVGGIGDVDYWRITCFFGFPVVRDRYKSRQLLDALRENGDKPWLCLGNFNEILQASEQEWGNPRRTSQTKSFQDSVLRCNLNDLGFVGNKFTWFTTREGH
ncbi:hypothetical protein EV1_004132 [Malus domestica]